MTIVTALLIILSMLSLPAHADTWLCIGEQQSFMSGLPKEIKDPVGGVSDNKYIVAENGVKHFGDAKPFMSDCDKDERNLVICKYSLGGVEAVFHMNEQLVFMLITKGLYIGEGSQTIMVEMGKCSPL